MLSLDLFLYEILSRIRARSDYISTIKAFWPCFSFLSREIQYLCDLYKRYEYLFVSGDFETMRIWGLKSQRELYSFGDRKEFESTHNVLVSCSPDGRSVACAGKIGNRVYIWDAETKELKHQIIEVASDNSHGTSSISYCPQGHYLVWLTTSGQVVIWDCKNNSIYHMINPENDNPFKSFCYLMDGTHLALADSQRIRIWNIRKKSMVRKIKTKNKAQILASSPCGQYFAAAYYREIEIWDIKANYRILENVTSLYVGQITTMTFSPDGQYLAWGSNNINLPLPIVIVNTRNWTPEFTIMAHNNQINSIKYSPDGQKLVSASEDHTITITQGLDKDTFHNFITIPIEYPYSIDFFPDAFLYE